jgi:CRISPR type III-associated protein (TIGR04423 family)
MSQIATKIDNLNSIPPGNYEGYIWMSDSEEPKVLNGEKFDFSLIQINPFIIEGLLFDKVANISIHIIHTGDYVITKYELHKLSSQVIEPKEYLPHRLKEIKKLLFKQIWEEKSDKNCLDFPVLTLKAIVFCGFKK